MLLRREVALLAVAAAGVSYPPVLTSPSPRELGQISYLDLEPPSSALKRVVLVRHGRTVLNSLGLPQGGLDAPLDSVGKSQAAALGLILAEGPSVAVVGSSPRLRAIQTADAIAAAVSRRREESRVDLDEVPDYIAGDPTFQYVDTRLRAYGVFRQLPRALQAGEVGVWVSHGRFLRVCLANAAAEEAKGTRGAGFLDEWKEAFPPGFKLENTAISVVDVSEGGALCLRCVNSVAHLGGGRRVARDG